MNYRHLSMLVSFLSLWLSFPISAASLDLRTVTEKGAVSLGQSLMIFEDKSGTLAVDEIVSKPDTDFLPPSGKVPNFGFSSSAYWGRIRLTASEAQSLVLEYGYPMADEIDFFLIDSQGKTQTIQLGDRRPPNDEALASRLPAWLLPFEPGESTLLLRVKSSGAVQTPLVLYEREEFHEQKARELTLLGALYGVIAGLFVYNLCLYFYSRSRLVLIYCASIACSILSFPVFQGFWTYLLPGFKITWLNNEGLIMFLGGTGVLVLTFCHRFLELDIRNRWLTIAFGLGIFQQAFQASICHFNYNLGAFLSAFGTPTCLVIILLAATYKVLKGDKIARLFLLAWLAYIVGGIGHSLYVSGVLPPLNIFQFGWPLGMATENILLSLSISFKLRRELSLALEENKRINIQLKEKDLARTQFFHNISHELRTPLNGILGFLELIRQKRYGEIPDVARLQIEKCLRLAEALKQQVNTILDLAKSKSGQLPMHRQVIHIEGILEQTRNLAEGLSLKYQGSHFELVIDPSVSSGEDFISDADHVKTILHNLLGNAFKFNDPLRPNMVQLRCMRRERKLIFEVRDQGIGIPGEFMDKIYEEFGQVQGDVRRAYEGSGLGLTMVRDLVQMLGGRIELVSTVGQGSCFTVTIPSQNETDPAVILTSTPLETASSMEVPGTLSPVPASMVAVDESGKIEGNFRILVVDDNEINCELIVHMLRETGSQLTYALSGRQALSLMQQQRPDLVLLDMMMPQMSGEDVLKFMRGTPQLVDVPVILITARASSEDKLHGLALGADDYLPKPIVVEELKLRVRNLLLRQQLVQKVAHLESQSKLLQMGQLFSDLSHEIKNILHGSLAIKELEGRDAALSLAAISLEDQQREILANGCLEHAAGTEHLEAVQQLKWPSQVSLPTVRSKIRTHLLATQLTLAELQEIWAVINTLADDELVYLENQMRLLIQHQTLHAMVKRTRELSLCVLTLSRTSEELVTCRPEELWTQIRTMIYGRINSLKVRVQNQIHPSHEMEGNPSKILQILLNLTMNAFDAVAALPTEERWLRVETHIRGDGVELRLINGGPKLSEDVQDKLFQRGFSTKGDNGTGIGLNLSQRLAASMGGSLSYDASTDHPCFVLSLHATDSQRKQAV